MYSGARLAAGQGHKTLNLFIIVALLEKMIYKSMTERRENVGPPACSKFPSRRESERIDASCKSSSKRYFE